MSSEREQASDNDIFLLACKLVDTAGSDRKTYWLPTLSQLCEAVGRRNYQRGFDEAKERAGQTAKEIGMSTHPGDAFVRTKEQQDFYRRGVLTATQRIITAIRALRTGEEA